MSNPQRRSSALLDWDKPKLLDYIRFLEACDGEVQIGFRDMETLFGWASKSVQLVVESAEAFGIIKVTRSAHSEFAKGRVPNRYVLLIDYESWILVGHAIVADWRRNGELTPRLAKRAAREKRNADDYASGALGPHTQWARQAAPPPGGAWLEIYG